MNKQTLEKAKDIECSIECLNDEVRHLSVIDDESLFLLNAFKKAMYKRFYCKKDVEISITKDDAQAMIELRKKKIAELEKELERL